VADDDDFLKLNDADRALLAEVEKLGEEKLVELLRDLRAERTLEYQIYSTREQWLWVPWTTCLGRSFVALSANSPVIRIGVVLVAGVLAFWIAHRRRVGLEASFDALNMRHKWVVHITRLLKAKARLRLLGFDERLEVARGSAPKDPIHLRGFRHPLRTRVWTAFIWAGLLLFAVLSSLFTWTPSEVVMPFLKQ
jgi:hypothetical protein